MSDNYGVYGISIDDILFNMKKMEAVMQIEKKKLEICLIGGTACLLTGLVNRATVDYDLLNLDYKPEARNYLNFFNPYDLVDFEATTIPRSYYSRTKTVFQGEYLHCKILGIEDLILSKLCRNLEKDFSDIDALIDNTEMETVIGLVNEVKKDINSRYPRIQANFMVSVSTFMKRYHIEF